VHSGHPPELGRDAGALVIESAPLGDAGGGEDEEADGKGDDFAVADRQTEYS
jgi:hypothetical protein